MDVNVENIARGALVFILCLLTASCVDHSSLPYKKLPLLRHNDRLESYDGELYGTMKTLTFNNKTWLFVGGRNAIYKIDPKSLDLVKETDKSHSIWSISAMYNRTYVSGSRQIDAHLFEDVYSTIDSCLSYVDRARMKWSKYNDTSMKIVFQQYPGAGMRFRNDMQWIRFREQFETFICKSAFIRGLEKVKLNDGSEALWACGTFGSFPKAFLVNPKDMSIINDNYDSTLPTCARWPDEPMATVVGQTGELYIASGWGLYKPFAGEEHQKKNKSMMLYSDWKMLTSGHHWFTRMAMLLGRDVSFIPRVFETDNYYFFFGHEVTPSLTYINSLTREVSQSFMLRVCKNDAGFKYTAEEDLEEIRKWRNLSNTEEFYTNTYYNALNLTLDQFYFSYSSAAYDDTYRVPTRHFVSAQKFPFGCYLKRYDGAQSLNRFWGEQNIVYFNRLADVFYSQKWVDEPGVTFNPDTYGQPNLFPDDWLFTEPKSPGAYAYNPNTDVWNPMIAAFSSPGMWQRRRWRQDARTGAVRPKGAICQFHVSEWKTDSREKMRNPPPPESVYQKAYNDDKDWEPFKQYREQRPENRRQFPIYEMNLFNQPVNNMNVTIRRAVEELFALYGSQVTDFFSRTNHWFQGGQLSDFWGLDLHASPNLTIKHAQALKDALKAGQCLSAEETAKLTREEFLGRMKTASTAWPTEWDATATKYFDAVYQMNLMQVAGDNASFVYDGVEFAKMFVMKWNYTQYLQGNDTSPLMYVLLVTTEAEVFRVVMCDITSIPIKNVTCEMKHTDQPYVTRMFQTMRRNHIYEDKDPVVHDPLRRYNTHARTVADTKFKQFRVSSLLSIWRASKKSDENVYPHDEDWQAPLLKDAVLNEESGTLTLLTSKRIMKLDVKAAAVCASYSACIHCASDPMCAWDITDKTCKPYKDFKRGVDSEPVQDVQNRGYACKKLLKNEPERKNFTVTQRDAAMLLSCANWAYFRGSIHWYYHIGAKRERINLMNSLHRAKFVFQESTRSLIVLLRHLPEVPRGSIGAQFECWGVSIDDEKDAHLLAVHTQMSGIKPSCDPCSLCNEKNAHIDGYLMCKNAEYCKDD